MTRKEPWHFRYLTIQGANIERPHLVQERVRCGKVSCRCCRGLRHGPYFYLRYEAWDDEARTTRYRREYVPRQEVTRVRRWVRRQQAKDALARAWFSVFRRAAQ